ncbi:hypothetical protein SFRURICE_008651 [Spodoptera frugiperda]|uniref:SFRICE_002685 n=1 Tax=Spodoptera frugiperda TaxID=7108 RepID=A0A2H1VF91_SPOFR|nr:hypothetical protein SFRURICE_008651 [Spodoptera frugiperda]
MSKYHIKCTDPEKEPPQQPEPPERPMADQSDLIALINPDRTCGCAVAGRAVSHDIPQYLAMRHIHNDKARKPEKDDEESEESKKKPLCKNP